MVDSMHAPVLMERQNQGHFPHSPPNTASASSHFMGGSHAMFPNGHTLSDYHHHGGQHRQGLHSYYHNLPQEQQQPGSGEGRSSPDAASPSKSSPSRPQPSEVASPGAAAWRMAPWSLEAEVVDPNQLRLLQQQQQRQQQLMLQHAKQRQHSVVSGPSSPPSQQQQQQQGGGKASFPREVGRNLPFGQPNGGGSSGGSGPVSWSVAVGASSGMSSPSPPTSPPLETSGGHPVNQAAAAAAAAAMTAMFAQQRLQDQQQQQRLQTVSPPMGVPSPSLSHSSADELGALRMMAREQARNSPPLPSANGYHKEMVRSGGQNAMVGLEARHAYGGAGASIYGLGANLNPLEQQALVQALMTSNRAPTSRGSMSAANGHQRPGEPGSLERTFLEEWERMEAAAIRLAQTVVNYEMRQGKASGADKPSVEKELEGANGAYFRPGAPVCVHFLQHGVCTWKSRVCPNSDTHHCGRCGRPHGTKAHAYLTRVLDNMAYEKGH